LIASPYDIFELEADGVLWLGTADTLAAAKGRAQQMAKSSSRRYLILDQTTGSRIVVGADGQVANSADSAGLTGASR
jgi:hypothetical protein